MRTLLLWLVWASIVAVAAVMFPPAFMWLYDQALNALSIGIAWFDRDWEAKIIAVLMFGLFGLLAAGLARRKYSLGWLDYTQDDLEQVRWHWDYEGTDIVRLRPICNNCGSRLSFVEVGVPFGGTALPEPRCFVRCNRCDRYVAMLDGAHSDVNIRILKRIRESIAMGRWRHRADVVERTRAN